MHIMRGMDSEFIDLIYLDPPFNSNHHYSAPIGSEAVGASFKDTWTLDDTNDAWWGEIADKHLALYSVIDAIGAVSGKSGKGYAIYMAIRLLEMHRILKPTGSLYLHCDPTMSHSLKLILDAIFGIENFRNEIIWHYGGRGAKAIAQQFARNHDTILFYGKSQEAKFERQYYTKKIPFKESNYRLDSEGRCFRTSPRGAYTDKSIKKLETEGRIFITNNGNIRIKYFEKFDGEYVYEKKLVGGTWNDLPDMMHVSKLEKTGYPTQKPLALLQRIIQASSNKGDIVFDPFCGCATTCIAAENLNRGWIGIDISPISFELIKRHAQNYMGLFGLNIIHRNDMPIRGTMKREKNIKHILFGKQKGACKGCKISFPFRNLTLYSTTPSSHDGTDTNENLQLLCGACKSNITRI